MSEPHAYIDTAIVYESEYRSTRELKGESSLSRARHRSRFALYSLLASTQPPKCTRSAPKIEIASPSRKGRKRKILAARVEGKGGAAGSRQSR